MSSKTTSSRAKRRWIPAFAGMTLFIFSGLSNPFEFQPGTFYSSGPEFHKRLALTFDDGPGPHTEKFLDLLDKYDVKATFFMLGKEVKKRTSIAKLVKERGHEIGNHSWEHVNYLRHYNKLKSSTGSEEIARNTSMRDLTQDLDRTQKLFEQALNDTPIFLRMPNGIDRPWINEVAKEIGLVLVNWTYGADWNKGSADDLLDGYVSAIRPGAILLFHDGGGRRKKSLTLAEGVLKAAKEQGYEIVPVGKLLSNNYDPSKIDETK